MLCSLIPVDPVIWTDPIYSVLSYCQEAKSPLPFPDPTKDTRLWKTSSLSPRCHEEINQGNPWEKEPLCIFHPVHAIKSQAYLAKVTREWGKPGI